ncbi:MAG: hypothetical protein ACLFTF_02315 [Desulfonatronovibrio sp.]
MRTTDTSAKPRRLSLKAAAGIVVLAIIFSVVVTLLAARMWLFPGPINPVDLNQREEQVLEAKLNTLNKAETDQSKADSGSLAPEPYLETPEDRVIYFTQRELNAMIARNPDLADRVSLHLSQGLISATMLVDLPRDFPVLGNKTVRVSTGLHIDYQQGRPVVTIKGVSIMGVPVPGAWLGGLKDRDLVSFYGTDAGFWHVFSQGVTDLRVEQGKLRVELAE